jgi:hypothetical protein
LETLIPFVHFPNVFHSYRITVDATAAGAQGRMPKTKKERHKNLFMSIFPEPDA